jgi:hypothetical protein
LGSGIRDPGSGIRKKPIPQHCIYKKPKKYLLNFSSPRKNLRSLSINAIEGLAINETGFFKDWQAVPESAVRHTDLLYDLILLVPPQHKREK